MKYSESIPFEVFDLSPGHLATISGYARRHKCRWSGGREDGDATSDPARACALPAELWLRRSAVGNRQ